MTAEQHGEVDLTVSLSICTIVFAALCVICSIILFIGVCTDKQRWLIPWIVVVATSTIFDAAVSIFLLIEALKKEEGFPNILQTRRVSRGMQSIDPFFGVLSVIDFIVCVSNVYSLLCVISQYQVLTQERQVDLRPRNQERIQVRYQAATSIQQTQPPAQAVRLSLTPSSGSSIGSTHRLLPSKGSNVSTNFLPSSSPVPILSRSSFSSTTETSCFSSEIMSSRRSSALPQDPQKQGLSPVGEDVSLPSTSAVSPVIIRVTDVDEIVRDDGSELDADNSDKMMVQIPIPKSELIGSLEPIKSPHYPERYPQRYLETKLDIPTVYEETEKEDQSDREKNESCKKE